MLVELILILEVLLLLEKEIGTPSPTPIGEISGPVLNKGFQAITERHNLVGENFYHSLKNCVLHLSPPGDPGFEEFRFLQRVSESLPLPQSLSASFRLGLG